MSVEICLQSQLAVQTGQEDGEERLAPGGAEQQVCGGLVRYRGLGGVSIVDRYDS